MNTNQNNKSSQDYQNYIQSNPSSNFDLKFSNSNISSLLSV